MKSSIPDLSVLGNITRITASFDKGTNKHQIDVTFSETVAQAFAKTSDFSDNSGEDRMTIEVLTYSNSQLDRDQSGDCGITSGTDHPYTVTVE